MMNLVLDGHRAAVLEQFFKTVPDSHVTRGPRRSATVSCVCGEISALSFGEVKTCTCGRIFWAGAKVYAAPPAEGEDHDCEAATIEARDGTKYRTDYCGVCFGDLL